MRFSIQIFVEADSREDAIAKRCAGQIGAVAIINNDPRPAIAAARLAQFRPNAIGPGTELKKILSKLGLKPKAGCKCQQRIQEMNSKGTDWCADNIDLIAGWLREEAQRSGYPFSTLGAKILIRRAIKNSRKAKTA